MSLHPSPRVVEDRREDGERRFVLSPGRGG